jgi:hypothetical protein
VLPSVHEIARQDVRDRTDGDTDAERCDVPKVKIASIPRHGLWRRAETSEIATLSKVSFSVVGKGHKQYEKEGDERASNGEDGSPEMGVLFRSQSGSID